jgi:hypothetical protein
MTSAWLDGFFTIQLANNRSYNQTLPENDFRRSGLVFFYYVATLCQTVRLVTDNGARLFKNDIFINAKALPRE